jgi:hypothetical protein
MINSVRQTVLSVLNKNNYGYISPSDFNLYAKQAQLEIFDGYFKELNQVINAENARMSGTEYADLNKSVREAIDGFSRTATLAQNTNPGIPPNTFFAPSLTTTGDDYYLLNKVLAGLIEAEVVSHGKITLLNSSLLTAPSIQYPAYTLEGNSLTVFPATFNQPGNVTCQYIRYPFDPKWTYEEISIGGTPVGGAPVFDDTATDYQDFELPIDEEPNLVYRILQLAGMSIREGDVYQFANAEEQQQ